VQGAVSGVKMRPGGSGFSAKGKRAVNQTLGKCRWPFRAGIGPKSRHGQENSGCVAEGFFAKSDVFSQLKCPQEGLNA
jgi:hypothetical protein